MLTIEERQNSLRYVIELDHCYTTRPLPEQTKAAAEPLSVVQHSHDANKNNAQSNNASQATATRGAAAEAQSKTRSSNSRTPVS